MGTPPASAIYTLPGVMHYLQTEFTRNERDRIGWELERSEMKTRIAQLEGENRTLRYELAKLRDSENAKDFKSSDSSIQEPLLLKSKLAVQENVKEIVYLLRSPHVTEQLQGLRDTKDAVHQLAALNLNTKSQPTGKQATQETLQHVTQTDQPKQPQEKQMRQATVSSFTPDPASQSRPIEGDVSVPFEADSGYGSDANTIIPEEAPTRRNRASSLFTSAPGKPTPDTVLRCKRLRYHLAGIEKLVISQYNMLSYARDGLMKHWMIEPNLNCNEKLTKSFHGLAPIVLGLFWLDNQRFLTVDNFGLKVWRVSESTPCLALDLFDENSDVNFSSIQSVDLKNSWLIMTSNDTIHIWEVLIDSKSIKIGEKYSIADPARILDSILGMTEKSLIVFKREPYEIVIYTFQGERLQKVRLQGELDKTKESTEQVDGTGRKLLLNKQTSKLMIQLANFVAVYSFDRKQLIFSKRLDMVPTSLIFNSRKDYVILAFDDGSVEVRNLKSFETVLKSYNHYDDETEYEKESISKHPKLDEQMADETLGELRQSAHKGVIIDVAEIDSTAVVISGGDDGMIRLELVPECV
ncbi:LADA_0G08790g1_1 [Lachancea dasiensis]|uniref:LADA_0G08790g1_1 n=1 Tax=Lachancea dasiensis TaxID=1072105 RepID=A0A1G4JU56_9SACH|nr:LADA_0G08790g1_1 [Lachancea dasiensis]